MGLEVSGQASWGGGIYRGRNAPEDSVYDAENALVDEEGNLFRRGGGAYFTAADAGVALTSLADLFLAPGRRLLAWGEYPSAASLFVLDEGAGSFVTLASVRPEAASRAVQLGSIGVFQLANGLSVGTDLLLYAGSLKTAAYSTGTVTVAPGALTVTGSGTSWSANVDVGMLFMDASGAVGVVAAVDSDTQITLREAWAGPNLSGAGATLAPYLARDPPASAAKLPRVRSYAASVAGRLVMAFNNRVYFSDAGTSALTSDQYHELPASEIVIGADSIADTLLLFTTGGVWSVSNMAFDAVDDAGNVQHNVQEISRDVILWGDAGIAARGTSFLVPAVDDMYLMSAGGDLEVIGKGFRPQYRAYVKAGYRPGVASVHRGHYFLPILSGSGVGASSLTQVDQLVVRLDREATPVTRWSGHAAAKAYARRAGAEVRAPQLLAVAGQRITDLTGCFEPSASNAADADGTAHAFTWTTRDFPTSGTNHPGTVVRARVRQELVDDGNGGTAAPALALAYSSDQDAGAFTTLTPGVVEASATTSGGVSDGSRYHAWPVGKQRERIRFRGTVTGAAASCVLRTIELLVRQSGLR